MWSLANIGGSLSKSVYGSAHGAGDLIYFLPTKYKSYILDYTFDSSSSSKSSVKISLTNGSKDNYSVQAPASEFMFNNSDTSISQEPHDSNSVFLRGYVGEVISRMYEIEIGEKTFVTGQTKTSERTAFVLKSRDHATFEDAYVTNLMVNGDFVIKLQDRYMMDMLVALFHINDLGLSKPDQQDVIRYVSTALHSYVISQLYIHQGVKLTDVNITINVRRVDGLTTSKELRDFYVDSMKSGKLVPLSLLHHLFFKEDCGSVWKDIIFWASMLNPGLNDELRLIVPTQSSEGKSFISLHARKSELLSSSYYQTDVALPWQEKFVVKITFEEFLDELVMRKFMNDEQIDCFPLVSKGRWNRYENSPSSLHIAKTHRLSKFSVKDVQEVMDSYISKVSLYDQDKPKYIKRLTRATSVIPPLFTYIVYGD